MKLHLLTFLTLSSLTMGACGTRCIETTDYDKVPYEHRTAGEGVAIYGTSCKTADANAVMVTREERRNAREPIRDLTPVFQDEQKK